MICYYFEIMHPLNISNGVLAWIWEQWCLFGRTQFPFILGILWHKYLVMDKIRVIYNHFVMKQLWLCLILILTFIFHCFVQSMIVAPITGMIVLTCFHLFEKPDWLKQVFLFLGRHSTNIWLVHMFFYLTLFRNLVFKLREPILIFIGMIVLCVMVSKLINLIEKLILFVFHRIFSCS